jgi:hypothetical protein
MGRKERESQVKKGVKSKKSALWRFFLFMVFDSSGHILCIHRGSQKGSRQNDAKNDGENGKGSKHRNLRFGVKVR